MSRKKAFVIGAGITGLSTGWKLSTEGFEVIILEKEDHIGGLACTFRHGDFHLDYGPHKLFTVMEDVAAEIRNLIGDEVLVIPKRSRIRLMGRYLNYPIGIKDLLTGINPVVGIQCCMSYLTAILKKMIGRPGDKTYREWIKNRFGTVICDLVFSPYAEKIWGDPDRLSKELAETRIAVPNLFEMLKQMVFGMKKKGIVMSVDKFLYPRYGIATLSQRLAEYIAKNGGTILVSKAVRKLHYQADRITVIDLDEKSLPVEKDDVVISTIPLSILCQCMFPAPPQTVSEAVKELKTRNLILLYLVVDKERVSFDNWIFFPGREYLFNRVFEQKGFSPYMIPNEKTVLCLEITCSEDEPLWNENENFLFDTAISQLEECGLVTRDEVSEFFSVRLKDVYQIYGLSYRSHKDLLMKYFDSYENLYTIGRHGAFNYVGMADCMDMGFRTATHVVHSSMQSRAALRATFELYTVID